MRNDITAAIQVLSDLLSEQIQKFHELKANGANKEDLEKYLRKIDFLFEEIIAKHEQLE